jgi:hypothetical protein
MATTASSPRGAAGQYGASSLLDLAVDLINDAKGATDGKRKIYLLEQVKEIVLHRDKSLLSQLLPSIMDFMIEKSTAVKKFLVVFCNDIVSSSMEYTPDMLNLYSYIVAENTESLLKTIGNDLRFHYANIVMYIVNLPPLKQKQLSSHGQANPNQMWQQLRDVINVFVDMISQDRSDSLRTVAIKLLEPVILFGLASSVEAGPKVNDPRLKRTAGVASAAATAGTTEQTANSIPLHHHFINRNEVEQEAEALLTKVLLWANRNGPQSAPFSPPLMSILGQVIAGIASARPAVLSKTTIAIGQLVQGKANVCGTMPGSSREQLARTVQRLIRSLTGKASEESNVARLRGAVAVLEGLGFEDTNGGKRERESPTTEDIDEQQHKLLRADAIAALNASETTLRSRSSAPTTAGLPSSSTLGETVSTASATIPSQQTETELANSIADLEAYTTSIRLGGVLLQPVPRQSTLLLPGVAPGMLQVAPVSLSTGQLDALNTVAFEAFIRLLDSFDEAISYPPVGFNERVGVIT